jgi:transcriptional regulator with AAA-type ATPase domain
VRAVSLDHTTTAAPRTLPRGREAERRLPFLCAVFEHERPLAPPVRVALAEVDRVELGRGPLRSIERTVDAGARVLSIRLPDPRMSSRHARLERVLGRWVLEDLGSKNGTFVDERPLVGRVALEGPALLQLGHAWLAFEPELAVPDGLRVADVLELDAADPLATLLPKLEHVLGAARQVARSEVPVLVLGPTGTGKEVTARALHALSGRGGPLVPVNCGAIPESLVESELFGHRKGAFSGATDDRIGLVRSADRGTLFLDEVGDLPLPAQAALLRVLQEREVLAVGAPRAVAVDFRCIAATHHPLDALVERGAFRRDLFTRLAGLVLTLPPLSERRVDLGLLFGRLLAGHALSASAAYLLLRHAWPGNVRELEQTLRTARVLAGEAPIQVEHLPPGLEAGALDDDDDRGSGPVGPLDPADAARRAELVELLSQHRGNVSAVARATGKARMQIQRWMKRWAIDPVQFRR